MSAKVNLPMQPHDRSDRKPNT